MTDSDSLDDILPSEGEGPARFTMSVGWCGGYGEAVLDPRHRILSRDGLPIYVDEESRRAVMDRIDLSGSWLGSPVVHVLGTARLDRRKERNSSIPGSPRQRFLALVLRSIEEVRLVGERANET